MHAKPCTPCGDGSWQGVGVDKVLQPSWRDFARRDRRMDMSAGGGILSLTILWLKIVETKAPPSNSQDF